MPFVSLIVPVFNEEEYISEFIDSVINQNYPQDKVEIILVDGGSLDRTLYIIEGYMSKSSNIVLLNNPQKSVPNALNLAISIAKGEAIVRLDVHASYPTNYVLKLITVLYETKADNVGASCVAIAKNKTTIGNSISATLGSRIGVGNSLFRLSSSIMTISVDTVPFGCFFRETFQKYGLFNDKLVRNQDLEYNKRILKAGGTVLLFPSLKFYYYCRETYYSFAKQNFDNGLWNILTLYYTKSFSSLSIRHFVPLCFVLFISLTSIFSVFSDLAASILFLVVLIYFLIILIVSIGLYHVKKISVFYTSLAFMVLHFSYGIGGIVGVFKMLSLMLSSNE